MMQRMPEASASTAERNGPAGGLVEGACSGMAAGGRWPSLSWCDGDLQHAIALMGEQVVCLLDIVELEAVRDQRPGVDTA